MARHKSTKYKGVRYTPHSTRKHGAIPDQYFFIRYQIAGKRKEEGMGWASDGMTAKESSITLGELKKAAKTGQGHARLSDKREAKIKADEVALLKKQEQDRKKVTYKHFYKEQYLPIVQEKKQSTLVREESLHKLWILPAIGKIPIRNIGELHILKIKRSMDKAKLAPRSVQYAFTCVQMVMAHAMKLEYHHSINPVTALPKSSRPRFDNRKKRFLSHDDAGILLEALAKKSQQVHDMTLLSIHCGLRFGEIASLTHLDVDQDHGTVTLRNTKSGTDRIVTMTSEVSNMFRGKSGGHGELVFPSRSGQRQRILSRTFARTVEELGFNAGLSSDDRKQKITFHSCRHTCASWLVMAGVPLYTVQKILGHSTVAMTERYAHLAPKEFKKAVHLMEQGIAEHKAEKKKEKNKEVKIA